MDDEAVEIIHLWQSTDEDVTFKLGKDYELISNDDFDGKKIYQIRKKKKNNKPYSSCELKDIVNPW